MMSIKQELIEKVVESDAATLLIDSLIWELVGKPNKEKVEQILAALKSHADSIFDELDGTTALLAHQEAQWSPTDSWQDMATLSR